ncbi:SGNH hydrolase-type esterase domain-containing protein [Venturia nashicola]|uniref:SGNH hydrolase-type esterase domain-containing protein n=1 Tax=Venturia nashicola TaxID=86259 RepID=A0A4Z1PAC4_9PEZI|nr:SGNH hydrolase-type esterase domain-containing protein [Venturia nashicola]TLD37420.1 SGNH hydrolase-type esterase domain-containing protein [Venturia nashicola]
MLFPLRSLLAAGWITLNHLVVHIDAAEVIDSQRAAGPDPSNGHWIDTWATMPQLTEPVNLPPPPFNGTGVLFSNSTIRQTLKVSVGGSQVRLKISNAFGLTNLPITAVTIAFPKNDIAGTHEIQPDTLQSVTFSGNSSVSIPTGALAVSDPLKFSVKAQSIITVTIYLKDGQLGSSFTSHPGSRVTSWWQFGNAVDAPSFSISDRRTQSAAHWYFLSSVEAWVPPSYGSFIVIGDSITDGKGSDDNKNNRWPDVLFARLQKNPLTSSISVANLAAGGNRILQDGVGPNALSRIDRDLLAHPGVKYAMVFEGVNDIGRAPSNTTGQTNVYNSLIQGYKQIVTRAHAAGIPIFAGTITPFSAPREFTQQKYSTPEREDTRNKINKWIRESGVFDAVIDFDAMIKDPAIPSRLAPEYNVGDYIHPNVKGYQKMGNGFPIEIFEKWKGGLNGFV